MKFEINIIKFLQTNASVEWINFFKGITLFGSLLGFFIVFIILFMRDRRLGLVFALTFALASAFNFTLKILLQRQRPFVVDPSILNYGGEDGFSMPSGHSMCAGLFATFLCFIILRSSQNKLTKILGCAATTLFAALIAFSRMVLGVHYLTDTIIGIFVGILFAFLGLIMYNHIRKRQRKRE